MSTVMSSVLTATPPRQALAAGDGPYKGLRSYETEDGHLFRGRQEATEQILAKILSSRTMILHAPSAAGKTSLINARVLSGLEARGWMAVRIRPRDNPMASVRFDILRQLLASPRAEARAITRAHEALAQPDEQLVIGQLLARYDELEIRDERRRALGAPVRMPNTASGVPGEEVNTHPMFCRLLHGSIDVTRFDEHVAVLCGEPLRSAVEVAALAYAQELECERSGRTHADLVAALSGATADLRTFFEVWWDRVACDQPEYGIVLCIDQFEELFTRYADPGPGRRGTRILDWRIRERFFQELDSLFTPARAAGASSSEPHGPTPSLRLVISLRDEFIAQLDRVRPVAERAETASFHLPLLTLAEAAEAIRDPALEYGYRYEQACFDDIIQKLAQERRFMEPAHLQIVCDRLWRACTQPPPPDSPPEMFELAAKRPADTIDQATYEYLGKAEGILRRFFLEFLASFRVPDQLELLEMLELLITPGGTRNIVEWSQLVKRPLRDAARRSELLALLQGATVVRAEWRHGTRFVELTHEFLIEPVRTAIKTQLYGGTESARLLAARRALEQTSSSEFRTDERMLLSAAEVDALLASNAMLKLTSAEMRLRGGASIQGVVAVGWNLDSAEVLLRSAVVTLDDADLASRARLRRCGDLYSEQLASRNSPSAAAAETNQALDEDTQELAVSGSTPLGVVPIVSEYLASPSSKVRLNAVRALGWLGTTECVEALAYLAMQGSAEEKAVAEKALEGLDEGAKSQAVAVLTKDLTAPAVATRAYLLLGRLIGAGAQSAFMNMSWRDRWRLASTPLTERRRRRTPGSLWRFLQLGILGGALGLILACALIAAAFRDDIRSAIGQFTPLLTFGLLIGAPTLIFSGTRRSESIRLHPDRAMASYIEIVRAGWTSFLSVPSVVLFVVVLLDSGSISLAALALVVVALAAIAVRVATLLVGAKLNAGTAHTRFLQTVLGGSAGAVITGIVVVLLWSSPPTEQTADFVQGWLFFVPAWFGLAYAFASADPTPALRGAVDAEPPPARSSRMIVLAAAGAAILLLIVATRGPANESSRFALQRVSTDERNSVAWKTSRSISTDGEPIVIDSLPAKLSVLVEKPPAVGSMAPPKSVTLAATLSGGEGEYKIVLRDSTGKKLDEEFTSMSLPPGQYGLEVGSHVDLTFDDYSNELAGRLAGAVSLGTKNQVPVRDSLRLRLTTIATDRIGGRDSTVQRTYSSLRLVRAQADSAIDAGLDSTQSLSSPNVAGVRNLNRAIELLRLVWPSDSTRVSWDDLNQVCWAGSIVGEARRVLEYCNSAVSLEKNASDVDSRGLARALTGDAAGAIQDFEWYRTESVRENRELGDTSDPIGNKHRALRRVWIADLRAGRPLPLATVRQQLSRVR
jgi:hypothetical protein